MPETTVNWADKIAEAQANEGKYKELDPGEYNFTVEKAEVKSGGKGDYLNMTLKVLDGERANARAFGRTFPNSSTPGGIGMFLRFLEAVGIDKAWLVSDNPSTQVIADNIVGRNLSAEVYIEDGAAVNQKTGEQYRSVKNYKAQGGTVAQPAAQAPAQSNGAWGTPSPNTTAPANPWG